MLRRFEGLLSNSERKLSQNVKWSIVLLYVGITGKKEQLYKELCLCIIPVESSSSNGKGGEGGGDPLFLAFSFFLTNYIK